MTREERKEESRAFYRALGERLRVARKTLGISESEAADAAGVTLRTYRKWEKGGGISNAGSIDYGFCEEFEVSMTWLYSGRGRFLADTEDELAARSWAVVFRARGVLTDAGEPYWPWLKKH
jgi:transcriptional regulator with XRE-family HTH domain